MILRKKNTGKTAAAEIKIKGKTVKLTNQQKVYWDKEGYTKGDLVNYYRAVAPYILPYLKDRPQSMQRHPNGINKPGFYQKDVDPHTIPSWIKTVQVWSPS